MITRINLANCTNVQYNCRLRGRRSCVELLNTGGSYAWRTPDAPPGDFRDFSSGSAGSRGSTGRRGGSLMPVEKDLLTVQRRECRTALYFNVMAPMLRCFPIAYEDELLYSLIARYHIHTCSPSFKQTSHLQNSASLASERLS